MGSHVAGFRPCRACGEVIAVGLDTCPLCLEPLSADGAAPPPAPGVEAIDPLAGGPPDPPVAPGPPSVGGRAFKDLSSYSVATRFMFAAWVAIAGIGAASNLSDIRLLDRLEINVGLLTFEQIEASETRYQQLLVLVIVGFVVSGVLFGAWLFRSYKNLDALGHTRRFKAWWAWGGQFVPIWSLFRTRQIVGEIWGATSPQGIKPGMRLVNWWWGLWIGGNLVFGAQVDVDPSDIGALRGALERGLAWQTAIAVTGFLAYLVVGRTTARLEAAANIERPEPRISPMAKNIAVGAIGVAASFVAFTVFDSPSAGATVDQEVGAYDGYGISFPIADATSVIEKGTFSGEPSEAFGMVVAQRDALTRVQTVEWFSLGPFTVDDLLDVVNGMLGSTGVDIDWGDPVDLPISDRDTVVRSVSARDVTGRVAMGVGATHCQTGRTVVVMIAETGARPRAIESEVRNVLYALTC